jgi:hypothetical protein
MIPLLVFYLHVVAIAAAFTRRWQEEGIAEGFLAVFFMLLIFFVGWSIAVFLMRLLMSPQGLGVLLDRDAASLLFLTVVESVFYYFFLKDDSSKQEKPTEAGNNE